MSIQPINSPEHQVHADGLLEALRDREMTYPHHCDPNPYMRRTRDPLATAGYPLTTVNRSAIVPQVEGEVVEH